MSKSDDETPKADDESPLSEADLAELRAIIAEDDAIYIKLCTVSGQLEHILPKAFLLLEGDEDSLYTDDVNAVIAQIHSTSINPDTGKTQMIVALITAVAAACRFSNAFARGLDRMLNPKSEADPDDIIEV